jgi:O-antigen/teichoic acid export membrane protein
VTPTLTQTPSLPRRLLLGLSANSLGQIIGVVIQLVSIPLLVTFWGKQMFGEWLLLSTIPAYLATSDMGFGVAAANEMGACVGRGDQNAALICFQTVWSSVSFLSLILTSIVIAAIQFLPLRSWAHITALTSIETIIVASTLAATVICNQQAGILLSGYKCVGRYAAGVTWCNLQRFGEFVVVIVAAAAGYRPTVAACAMLIVGILTRLAMHRHLRKCAPWLIMGVRYFRWQCLVRLWRPALSFLAWPCANALRYQGMASVVGIAFGPVALVGFSAIRTMCNIPMQLSNSLSTALWPELSIIFGSNNTALASRLHIRACQASLVLSAISIAFLAVAGQSLIRVWTKGRVQLDPNLFFGFLAMVGMNALWNTSAVVPTSVNKHYELTACIFILTAIAVFTAYVAAPHSGIGVISWLLCAEDLILTLITIRVSLNLLGETPISFLRALLTLPSRRRPPSFGEQRNAIAASATQ